MTLRTLWIVGIFCASVGYIGGCAAGQAAAKAVSPIAADLLLDLIADRGGEVNKDSAVCVELGDDPEVAKVQEQTGEVYVLCWAEAQ